MNQLIISNQPITSMQIAEIIPDSIPAVRCDDKQKGVVYVLDAGDSVKIGRTSNPKQRIPTVIRISGRPVKRVIISPFCKNYIQLENMLHKKFSGSRAIGEWFHEKCDLIVQEMRAFDYDISESKPRENKMLKLFDIAMQMEG
jgi:hypothetical protein